MKQLTRDEAARLFLNYAFFVGNGDVIPEETARVILSDAAVDFMRRTGKPGESFNAYGIGDRKQLVYVTFKGFLEAVSFRNVELYYSEPRAVNLPGQNLHRKEPDLIPLQADL